MPKEVIHDDTVLPGSDNSTPFAVQVGWSRDTYVQIGTINLQPNETGWFVDMSRKMINDLIKVLRRARDQAYGVDE